MIRVVLPAHLRTLARVDGEVNVEVEGDMIRLVATGLSMKSADKPGVTDKGLGLNEYGNRSRRRDGIHDYMHDALVERHAHPGTDILSELLQAQIDRDADDAARPHARVKGWRTGERHRFCRAKNSRKRARRNPNRADSTDIARRRRGC